MTIQFYEQDNLIKMWYNVNPTEHFVPNKGDCVLLHFGDYNEEERCYTVCNRYVSGTSMDVLMLQVELQERKSNYREDSVKVVGKKLDEIDGMEAEKRKRYNWNTCKNGYEVRFFGCCHEHSIETVGQLLDFGRVQFSQSRNIGRRALEAIDKALSELYEIKVW